MKIFRRYTDPSFLQKQTHNMLNVVIPGQLSDEFTQKREGTVLVTNYDDIPATIVGQVAELMREGYNGAFGEYASALDGSGRKISEQKYNELDPEQQKKWSLIYTKKTLQDYYDKMSAILGSKKERAQIYAEPKIILYMEDGRVVGYTESVLAHNGGVLTVLAHHLEVAVYSDTIPQAKVGINYLLNGDTPYSFPYDPSLYLIDMLVAREYRGSGVFEKMLAQLAHSIQDNATEAGKLVAMTEKGSKMYKLLTDKLGGTPLPLDDEFVLIVTGNLSHLTQRYKLLEYLATARRFFRIISDIKKNWKTE